MNNSKVDLTYLIIATGRYLEYASHLVKTIASNSINGNYEILLFNDVGDLDQNLFNSQANLISIKIPPYEWPDATLLRYQIFTQYWERVQGQIVMYLDADTEVVSTINIQELKLLSKDTGFCGVLHPGYFEPNLKNLIVSKRKTGPWETNRRSKAYVPITMRSKYIAGGVWFGKSQNIKLLCDQLSSHIQDDLSWGFIAKWHDESHLNWWKSKNKIRYLTPEWALDPDNNKIAHIKPIIRLITKPESFFDR